MRGLDFPGPRLVAGVETRSAMPAFRSCADFYKEDACILSLAGARYAVRR
jgi:hypothetical protein